MNGSCMPNVFYSRVQDDSNIMVKKSVYMECVPWSICGGGGFRKLKLTKKFQQTYVVNIFCLFVYFVFFKKNSL